MPNKHRKGVGVRIQSVEYRNYRSIEAATLDNCSSVNILIGKNNSGKSNLLKGINEFFASIKPDPYISPLPGNSAEQILHVDCPESETARIILTLQLDNNEKDQLNNEISAESPQLTNALTALPRGLLLAIELTFSKAPAMSYVSCVSLVSKESVTAAALLKVPPRAAEELFDRATATRLARRDIRVIEEMFTNVDEIMYRANREDASRTTRFSSMPRRLAQLSPNVREQVDAAIRTSREGSVLHSALTEIQAQLQDSLDASNRVPLTAGVQTFGGDESKVPDYIINLLERVHTWSVHYLDEARVPVGGIEARRLLSFKMRRGGSDELRAIQSAVSELLGVQIDAFESSTSGADGGDHPAEMDVDDFLVQLNGSGIREALRLILDVNFINPKALLLEEPEVHLHPALEYSLLQYLKEEGKRRQIFVTTHSTNFIDTAGESNVYLVSRKRATEVRRLDIEQVDTDVSRELGIRLSSVFMFDRLVFVEGPSDELILRDIAGRLQINLAQYGVGFVQMKGSRGVAHYANAATMEILTRRNVAVHFVIDRDERSDEEISRIRRMCDGKAHLHVLGSREIENYFLDAGTIRRLIEIKSGGQKTPSIEEVQVALNRCIEELRDQTERKHITSKIDRRYFLDYAKLNRVEMDFKEVLNREIEELVQALNKVRETSEKILEEGREQFNAKWSSNPLAIVPGADAVDNTLKVFGLRYRKERDASSLVFASEIEPHSDLREILRRLSS
jgi:predicted ATP-dependent endonuclease of OLD family